MIFEQCLNYILPQSEIFLCRLPEFQTARRRDNDLIAARSGRQGIPADAVRFAVRREDRQVENDFEFAQYVEGRLDELLVRFAADYYAHRSHQFTSRAAISVR